MSQSIPPSESADDPVNVSAAFQAMLSAYIVRAQKNLQRCQDLLELHESLGSASSSVSETQAADLLRAVVVLTHASMEDCLRTVGKYALPTASCEALNGIPFYSRGRPFSKVSLGHLSEYRGLTVESLIAQTVEEHLDRESFSSTTDIVNLLSRVGISPDSDDLLADLDEMINRRHEIVHRADIGEDWRQPSAPDVEKVRTWVGAVSALVVRIAADLVRNETAQNENDCNTPKT